MRASFCALCQARKLTSCGLKTHKGDENETEGMLEANRGISPPDTAVVSLKDSACNPTQAPGLAYRLCDKIGNATCIHDLYPRIFHRPLRLDCFEGLTLSQ